MQGAGLQADVYNVIIRSWSMALISVQVMRQFLSTNKQQTDF